jgi:cation transport protein ChaC
MALKRELDLTPDLVALVHRAIDDPGPDPNLHYHTEADYDAVVRDLLKTHRIGEDLWLFAYGSLIWRPEVEHSEERIGTARGWHRAFRLRITRWRATKDQPGLMMVLDRGGQCKGVLLRLPAATLRDNLGRVVRREMSVKPSSNRPRWIKVDSDLGPVRAIAFVIDRNGRTYAGKLSSAETAEILARACGHWGSCAEYLHNTVVHLSQRGIHDRNLWRLQKLVAERIAARMGGEDTVS